MAGKPTIEELNGPQFERIDELRHDDLLPFAAHYFFERTSWIIRLHHTLSLAALLALAGVAVRRGPPWLDTAGQFLLGFVVMFAFVLPLHEALHALAYLLCGAREIRWKMIWKYLAAYVVAERFVAGRGVFFFVALVPFVLITPAVILMAVVWPAWSVLWLTVLLWHTAGVSGDWALMNYYWLHRHREISTWDEDGRSYFYARAA